MGGLKPLATEEALFSSEQIGEAPAELEKVLIDDLDDGDPSSLSAARGVVLGMVLGGIAWAVILAVILWVVL